MPASAFTESERRFIAELRARGVRFMIVGMSAALIQGARGSTEDIDLWFEDPNDPRIAEAVRAAGGIWVSGSFGMQPPRIGGELGERAASRPKDKVALESIDDALAILTAEKKR